MKSVTDTTKPSETPETDAAYRAVLDGDCLPGCDSYGHEELCPYCNGDRVMAEFARSLESRLRAAEEALRELHTRTESFWALVQGEYGVKLSSADHEDHNVYEFFAAMDAARRLVSHEGEKGE